jgi:transcription elongation GreA/GreB family factor
MRSEHLNEYLEISGVSTGEPILKSLRRLDEFLRYDIGRYFYFERYGIGAVIEVYPDRKEIVLDFEHEKRHFLTIDVAKGLLTPLHEDHFLYIKHTSPEKLQDMATHKPLEMVIMLLKSWKEPLTAAQIKSIIEGIVDKKGINKFWETVRKKLEKDPHIEVRGRTNKQYSYAASSVDKEAQARAAFAKAMPREKFGLIQDFVRNMPVLFTSLKSEMIRVGNRIFKKDPALALDILLFCEQHAIPGELQYTMQTLLDENEPVALLKKITDADHQKRVLKALQEMNPGTWTKIYNHLMLSLHQPKVLDEIYHAMKTHENVLKDTFFSILSTPMKSPNAYRWMLKKMIDGELPTYATPAYLPRIIESLDHVTGIRAQVLTFLSLERFDTLIKQAQPDEAQRILDTITINETLEEYQKNDLIKIIEYHHPGLAQKTEEIIYTTAHALKKRQEELDRIVQEEMPANKKEISRAREFGDLSENFEYKAAREKQAQLMEKARIIEQELLNAVVIDPAVVSTVEVSVGTRVFLVDETGQSVHYTILGRWDTDLERHILSNEAPAAQHLLGKKVGDTVTISGTALTVGRIEKAL